MSDSAAVQPSGEIVARVDFQYRWRTWAIFLALFCYGLWSLHDGFIAWPRDNAAWEQARLDPRLNAPPKPPHETSGVLFNQIFGVLLTLGCIPIFAWRAYRSRGEYRFSGKTLRVPGHPEITFDQIQGLDLVQWERKGLAAVEYTSSDGTKKSLTLCDMIYEREATDRIVKEIEAHLEAQEKSSSESQPPGA
jgi:hypothetical protein